VKSVFAPPPFFQGKKTKPIFLKKINNLQNISPKLYFLGGGSVIYLKKKLNSSLNLRVEFREFSEKEIRKKRELAGNLEMGNS